MFAPEVSLEAAYALDVVRTKFDKHGSAISSVSAPHIQAMMLEQAQVTRGMRVLEIGSGGYHAALLAELVGPAGEVTTIDVDPDIVARATRFLTAAGYGQVAVVLADAEHGVLDRAPYDRVIVAVGAWDIPSAWTDQLAENGRLVVPLRLRGLTRSVALDRADGDGHWASVDHQMCGFVSMQGAGARDEHVVALHDDVCLRIEDDLRVDIEGLRRSLLESAVQRWSGVEVANAEPFDGLHLWLATAISGFGRLAAEQVAVDNGLVDRMARWNTPAAIDGASFAYLATLRPNTDNTRHEFGVRARGPDAE
ncbi:methyltransferase, FxLD system [Saccharopolyspora hattusasensis]|uniref:methyltransferase, FxLD system n=1 Tax=Saccharopolyspora hattusasensis TaxID=1128679 RepID=UPI003D96628C